MSEALAKAKKWTAGRIALYAVDAEPRLSLVMVAYASGAVLSMISILPVTPSHL